jgi:hypothetical protein
MFKTKDEDLELLYFIDLDKKINWQNKKNKKRNLREREDHESFHWN